ncbi:MAG TPA: hypothetical protein DCF63_04285 [Planctomycetaceae bacterium]|nr:hypothetical protein [Planctomycetaceae bacterium]
MRTIYINSTAAFTIQWLLGVAPAFAVTGRRDIIRYRPATQGCFRTDAKQTAANWQCLDADNQTAQQSRN